MNKTLKVLHTSDLHSQYHGLLTQLETIEGLDLWIDTGDFFPNHTRGDRSVEPRFQEKWAGEERTNIAARLARVCIARNIKVLTVGGNHDYVSLAGLLQRAGMPAGTVYDLSLAKAPVSLCGLVFAGFREIQFIAGEWNGETELADFRHIVDRAMDHNPDILLTHSPAGGILDEYPGGHATKHDGIPYLTSYLMNRPHRVTHHLFGHVHEDGGKTLEVAGILFSNAAHKADGNLLEIPCSTDTATPDQAT